MRSLRSALLSAGWSNSTPVTGIVFTLLTRPLMLATDRESGHGSDLKPDDSVSAEATADTGPESGVPRGANMDASISPLLMAAVFPAGLLVPQSPQVQAKA